MNSARTSGRSHEKKKNLDTDITLITKMNSKQLTGLNVKHKTPKLLEYNIGGV